LVACALINVAESCANESASMGAWVPAAACATGWGSWSAPGGCCAATPDTTASSWLRRVSALVTLALRVSRISLGEVMMGSVMRTTGRIVRSVWERWEVELREWRGNRAVFLRDQEPLHDTPLATPPAGGAGPLQTGLGMCPSAPLPVSRCGWMAAGMAPALAATRDLPAATQHCARDSGKLSCPLPSQSSRLNPSWRCNSGRDRHISHAPFSNHPEGANRIIMRRTGALALLSALAQGARTAADSLPRGVGPECKSLVPPSSPEPLRHWPARRNTSCL